MATAALFKPTQALQDALKAYVVKIDSETISDIPLKATLVFEALQKYNVSPTVLGEILGKSTETIEAYISQRIDPTMRVQFGGTNYLEIDRAKVERQIKSVKTFANLTFQGGMSDEWYTNDMAKKLARVGISDIMDFAEQVDQNNFEIPAGSIVQKDYSKDEISYFWPEMNGEEFIKAHFVDSNNVIEIDDGIDIYYRLLNRDIGSRPTNYYYNKKNGQKFPLENGTRWESAFEGKGGVYYNVKFSETGIPIFYTEWFDTSDLTGLMPLISIGAMAFTFGGGAAWLGGNILGSVGLTASPTITAAVGTVAFNTAVTGGDIENAVKKTAASLIGNEFGGAIGASADSVAIGKAASIATTATLQGKQIDPASIAFAMFQSDKTGKNMDDFEFDPGNDWTGGFDDYLIDQSLIDITLADLDISTDPLLLSIALEENEIILSENGIDVSEITADGGGTLYTQDGSFVGMSSDQYVDSIYVDEDGHVRGPDNEIIIEKNEAANLSDQQMSDKILADMETKSGQVTRSIAAPASRPASIPPAANETKQPTISDSFATYDKILKSVVSIGASVKAISNGTFRPTYATSPYGTPRVQAVGVPIRQPNGSTITNNGNGTQTIRYVDGTTQTTSSTYTGLTGSNLFGGINTTTLAIGGGVLLVAFLLARRK